MPEAEHARPERFEKYANLGDNAFGRADDELHVFLACLIVFAVNAIFGRLNIRIPADCGIEEAKGLFTSVRVGELAGQTLRRCFGVIAWREHPLRATKSAAAIQERLAEFLRFFFRLCYTDLLEIAEILWPCLITFLRGDIGVQIPHLNCRLQEGGESNERIPMLGAPNQGVWADDPWNPDGRMRLLNRQRPGIDVAIVEML